MPRVRPQAVPRVRNRRKPERPPDGLQLLSANHVAFVLGVSETKVFELGKDRLPCVRIDGATKWRRTDVDAYVKRLSA